MNYEIRSGRSAQYQVGSGDQLRVDDGGVSSASVISGGREQIDARGVGDGDLVLSGTQDVSGSTSGAVLSGGKQYVESGATTTATQIRGGAVEVLSGGVADLSRIAFGREQVDAGGLDAGATISSGGQQDVYGSATGAQILGGQQYVEAGAAVSGTEVRSGTLYVAGSSLHATVDGGRENVLSNGLESDATIANGGYQDVYAGGLAVSDVVGSGGYQQIDGGATASGTVVSGMGRQGVNGIADDARVLAGGAQFVLDGGSALRTQVSGGAQTVSSGGTASGTTIDGGSQDVQFGGTVSGTAISGGSQTVEGTASGTAISGGTQDVGSGGLAVDTAMSGGRQTVEAGGATSGGTLTGVNQKLYGTETGVTLSGGTFADVFGTASGTVADSGARQYVEAGGAGIGTVILAGGRQDVIGIASGTQVSGGRENVYQSGTDVGGTVYAGGFVDVYAGGVLSAATISGGKAYVESGGMLAGATAVLSGGNLELEAGVDDSGVAVSSGGTLTVGPGRTETGYAVSNGVTLVVVSNGATRGTSVANGGLESVSSGGTATGTTISGGQQVVSSGGTATGTTVAGGLEVVEAGGTSSNTTIAGGTLDVQQGATTSGAITFAAPGTLEIDAVVSGGAASAFASEIDGLADGDRIDLTGFAYGTGATSATISGSVLTVTDGRATETFALGSASAHYVSATQDGSGGILLTAVSALAPAISGLASSTPSGGTTPVMPFQGATVTDLNDGGGDTDTLTIVQTGAGTLSNRGALLPGTASGGTTTYVLSGTAAALTAELDGLTFTPAAGTPNTSATTGFALTDASPVTSATASGATSVVATTAPVAPVIVGGGTTSTTQNAPVNPFVSASVSDPNADSTDTLSIQVGGGGGTLSGTGLGGGTDGLYTLSGTAQAVTSALEALTFKPAPGGPGTTTTTFVLTDEASAGPSATDRSTRVVDTVATPPNVVSISPQVSYQQGVFTLAGTASSAAGVRSVEISAQVDGVVTDLGAATVDANGNFSFKDAIGAHTQGFITATETDGVGGTASAQANYSLTGGLDVPDRGRAPFVAEQDSYTADGSAVTATSLFRGDGSPRSDASRRTTITAPGQTVVSDQFDDFKNGGTPETTFVFNQNHGLDTISLFRADGADHDTLSFTGSDFGNSIANVLDDTRQTAGGTTIIADPVTGDTVKLVGITKKELTTYAQQDITFHS